MTHLYQHYFPTRYASLSDHCWGGLKSIVRRWVNVYRLDDYVGTDIEPVPTWTRKPTNAPVLVNVPIGPGGHVGYWRQPEVFEFPQVRDTLPG